MYLHSLKIFCDVVRHHSFSRGALANHVSQSAASQAILQIEKTMGVDLLDRSKRPWELTPQGRVFFDGAQDIVTRFAELTEAMRQQVVSGYTVRVAAIYSVGLQDMSQYERRFKELVPGAEVKLEYMHPERVVDRVLSGQADLGLLAFGRVGPELAVTPWREEAMVFTTLPGHRLAGERSIRAEDLHGERFVAFDPALAIRKEVDRFLRRKRVSVEVSAEFDSIENIKRAIEEGVGVSILPEPTLRREIEQGSLVVVPIAGVRFVRPLRIIHRKKLRLNPAVQRFLELLTPGGGLSATRDRAGRRESGGLSPSHRRIEGRSNGASRTVERVAKRT